MNNTIIPTAEELIKTESNLMIDDWEVVEKLMIKFAELHCKEQLTAIKENVSLTDCTREHESCCNSTVDLLTIENTYSLSNIK